MPRLQIDVLALQISCGGSNAFYYSSTTKKGPPCLGSAAVTQASTRRLTEFVPFTDQSRASDGCRSSQAGLGLCELPHADAAQYKQKTAALAAVFAAAAVFIGAPAGLHSIPPYLVA